MKKLLLLITAILYATIMLSQYNAKQIVEQNGEVYFMFKTEKENLNELSKIISIDNYRNGYCYAYANKKQLANFINLKYDFQPVNDYYKTRDSLLVADSLAKMFDWNLYPTYGVYEEMMQYFANNYPDICHLDTIGTTFSGYKLLVLKISDNIEIDEPEPEFFLGGQMHGDELIGGVLCLYIIDQLLSQYNTNQQAASIINELELYINPISNPEGAYILGPNEIKYAIRDSRDSLGLEHFIDLNRNFPDFIEGDHPDAKPYALETQAFMQFADDHHFAMAANIHSGAEVVNYPFDTEETLPADNDWWKYVSAQYVNNVRRESDNTYFIDSEFETGYINGYSWYRISGSRQDYMNYYKNCREVTLELSNQKAIPNEDLYDMLVYNKQALFDYIEQARYGLHGVISDSLTNEPVEATVIIHNHDYLNSQVYSSLPHGDYHRYLSQGSYNVSFYADGYIHKTITVDICNNESTFLDVKLVRGYDPENISSNTANETSIFPNPTTDFLRLSDDILYNSAKIYTQAGQLVFEKKNAISIIDVSMLEQGTYILLLNHNGKEEKYKFVKM